MQSSGRFSKTDADWLKVVLGQREIDLPTIKAIEPPVSDRATLQAIQYFCREGRFVIVQYLLDHLISLDERADRTSDLMPSWCAACANGHLKVVRLVEHHMDTENLLLSEEFPVDFDRALFAAKSNNYTDVLKHMRNHDMLQDESDWSE